MSYSWCNSNFSIFKVTKKEEIIYMNSTSISKLIWMDDNYKAKVLLIGYLPFCSELNELKNEETIKLLNIEKGPRDWFNVENLAIELTDCEIKRKFIVNLPSLLPKYQEIVSLYVSIFCKAEMFL